MGFPQIMSLVTATLAQEQFDTEMKFEMLYTVMPTPEFKDGSGLTGTFAVLVPVLFFTFASTGFKFIQSSEETHEQKI